MARRRRVLWPAWWDWDLELSPHLLERMDDRAFNETDLRAMLETARGLEADLEPGRWAVQCLHDARPWEVVVEPDSVARHIVVITAYPVEAR